jgi:hypothetical protein
MQDINAIMLSPKGRKKKTQSCWVVPNILNPLGIREKEMVI